MIASVPMTSNRLFPLNLSSANFSCLSKVIDDNNWLWHMGFGHLNFDSLKFLANKRMVGGLPNIINPGRVCDMRVLEKEHRDTFQTGKSWRARRPLKIIHSNLCIVEVPSNGGCRYFITFIDNFSRKAWVYFLKQKFDACDTFKIF